MTHLQPKRRKPKLPKPVEAWAIVGDAGFDCFQLYPTHEEAEWCASPGYGEVIIPVRIVPIVNKPKTNKRTKRGRRK